MIKLKMLISLLFIGSLFIGCDKEDISEPQKVDSNLGVDLTPKKNVSRANYSASTWQELRACLYEIEKNNSGGVIEITADINSVSDYSINIPANTTISGGGTSYGVGGKTIAAPYLPRKCTLFLTNGEHVTIEGLIIKGPWTSAGSNWNFSGASGINFGPNANYGKVQNCDISGFPGAAISTTCSIGNEVYANKIHDNIALNVWKNSAGEIILDEGLGYGVMVSDAGYAYIHHNIFDNNRHAIAGGGDANNPGPQPSYDARYNEAWNTGGTQISHHFDMHGNNYNCDAGSRIRINNNNFYGPKVYYAVVIRGNPKEFAYVFSNTYSNISVARVKQMRESSNCTSPLVNVYYWK
ncbi:MAG: hypothetical protein EHM93_09245 [Bacteroidales bacterium]|nr:MAG: hypothetical protein EHM93_09245 [Bacteroidales bacterium]